MDNTINVSVECDHTYLVSVRNFTERKHIYHFEIVTINPGNALPISFKGTLGDYFENGHHDKKTLETVLVLSMLFVPRPNYSGRLF